MRNVDLSIMSMNSDSYYRHTAKKFIFDGIEYDSTLEARWACAFAEACIEYEYNSRIVDLGRVFQDGRNTKKPDFYLPQVNMWAEVKPEPFADMLTSQMFCMEVSKMSLMAHITNRPVLLLMGWPGPCSYQSIEPDGSHSDYVLFDDSQYHLTENRFYQNCGFEAIFPYPIPLPDGFVEENCRSIEEARGLTKRLPNPQGS